MTKEIFARNLLQPGRELTLKEIQNEIRAVEKVCLAENPHPNIVKVLRHGTFPMTRHICLDLELCEFTLECYIKERLWKPTSEEIADAAGEQGGPKLELLTRTRYIWAIMFQVASGLEFIHGLKEVHRDLKPRNGNSHDKVALIVCSSLFPSRARMEAGGFWHFDRRNNFHGSHNRIE